MDTLVLNIAKSTKLINKAMFERLLLLCEKYPLDFISHLSSSLPILIGIIRLKYLSSPLKLIGIFFLFFFIVESIALWMSLLGRNNLYIQNIEACVSTGIIGIIFLYYFNNPLHKKLIIAFTLISGITIIYLYKSSEISTADLSIFRGFAIILSLAYFNRILVDMRVQNITKHSMFWFTSGLLIYTAGTFFSSLFSEYWYQDTNRVSAEEFNKYWNISQILFTIFCSLAAFGLWVSKQDRENQL